MKFIYIDDIRPMPKGCPYDGYFHTVSDTMKFIRHAYKAGTTNFFLDMDHDAGDYAENGKDYIDILNQLETLYNAGKMKHIKLKVHFHSGNVVGIANMRAIIEHNHKWMEEV